MQKHISNYSKTRDVYVKYREAGYSKKFRAEHEGDIILHQAAKEAFEQLGLKKLPTIKTLQTEYATLSSEKKKLYADYKTAKEKMVSYANAKANADQLLDKRTAPTGKENDLIRR